MGNRCFRYVLSILLLLVFNICSAVEVDVRFSDWYWLNGKAAVNYNFSNLEFSAKDHGVITNVDKDWGVYCGGKCYIEVWSNHDGKRCVINPAGQEMKVVVIDWWTGKWYPFDDINARIKKALPVYGVINKDFSGKGCKPKVWVFFKFDPDSMAVASTDNGLQPLDPLPPVNVFCRVDGLSNSEINFGVVNQESKTASITASLICDGDYTSQATARLIFTDANRSGGDTIVLTNPQNKQQLKVKLSVDAAGASNKRDVTVKVGYKGSVELFAYLDESELKKETSGDFTGSAVIIFNVI
ncbi:hypothetical protein [Serratia marcescens]|uniref:hypothetical protein n=1 Tax=Serratia marcescens TaxID=615 RepID=UPI002D9C871E|nr:hypothetical protein [Serratia marcescens]MEB5613803.1 hypothetical protein [Serratia marcescens]